MKARGVILSICAMMVFFASYACANEPEPIQPSSAKPVMVPYLNKNINEVTEYGCEYAMAEYRETTGSDREEAGQDLYEADARFGAVLKNAGTVEEGEREMPEPMPELVESEPDESSAGGTEDPVLTYLGEWTTTGYCSCEICCGEWATGCTASGVLATSNHTVACGILPFGTQIVIDGVIYTVEDTGVDGEWVDIFFDTHDEALAYGMQTKSIWRAE